MDLQQIDLDTPISNGDKLRFTFNVMSVVDNIFGWLDPVGQEKKYNDSIAKATTSILANQTAGGYSVLHFENLPKSRKFVVDLRVNDITRFSAVPRGLAVAPVVVVAIAYAVIAIVAVIGINMALDRVDRILEKPIPALAFIALGGIALWAWWQSEQEKKRGTTT